MNRSRLRRSVFMLGMLGCLLVPIATLPAQTFPNEAEGDMEMKDFRFQSGETLPVLRIHYVTLGTLQRDAAGHATNAVIILHPTEGQGMPPASFTGALFGPGQLLDASRYYLILPDAIGHGKSSRPSDGLRAKFPHYNYEDMVEAQYRLVTEKLGVDHLRLVMGMSMGGMQSWLWAVDHPDIMDAVMPMACLPKEISGRNRMLRKMVADGIRNDPDWDQGNYTQEPRGLVNAFNIGLIASSSALQLQRQASTSAAADAYLANYVSQKAAVTDANDLLYQVEAMESYDPEPRLGKIVVPVMAVNSADDVINPHELGIAEAEIKNVKRGKFVLIPISDRSWGHLTFFHPETWKQYLAELLHESVKSPGGE